MSARTSRIERDRDCHTEADRFDDHDVGERDCRDRRPGRGARR
jgi:hypothetical protein